MQHAPFKQIESNPKAICIGDEWLFRQEYAAKGVQNPKVLLFMYKILRSALGKWTDVSYERMSLPVKKIKAKDRVGKRES